MDKALLPYFLNSSKSAVPSLLGFWLGFHPEVVRYHRELRQYGKSKWTFSKKLTLFLDVMLGFSIKPYSRNFFNWIFCIYRQLLLWWDCYNRKTSKQYSYRGLCFNSCSSYFFVRFNYYYAWIYQ